MISIMLCGYIGLVEYNDDDTHALDEPTLNDSITLSDESIIM